MQGNEVEHHFIAFLCIQMKNKGEDQCKVNILIIVIV